MDGFAEIEQRIEGLCARVSSALFDVMPADVEDVLGDGYVYALQADAYARRLHARLDACLGDANGSLDEARRIAAEKQALERSTRRLRARLAVLRSLGARSTACAGSG